MSDAENPVKMDQLFLDSNQWIYLATDPLLSKVMDKIEKLVAKGSLNILTTKTVRIEFERNIDSALKESVKKMGTVFFVAKNLSAKGIDPTLSEDVAKKIDALEKAGLTSESVMKAQCEKARALLNSKTVTHEIEESAEILRKASDRTLQKRAPSHKDGKSSYADTLLYESFCAFASKHLEKYPDHRAVFSTFNKKDFSNPDRPSQAHSHLEIFTQKNVLFVMDLGAFFEGLTAEKFPGEVSEHLKSIYDPRCRKCGGPIRSFGVINGGSYGPIEHGKCESCGSHQMIGDALGWDD
jgi:hypothetical protein